MILNKLFSQFRTFNLGYVVGEILLIFIGISLSFYFEEWRTERQNRRKEIEILKQIFEAVKTDTSQFRILSSVNDFASNKMAFLLDTGRLEATPSKKTLECFSYLTYYHQFTSDFSAYESLKNEGLSMISNQNLRIKIISYYGQMSEQQGWTGNIGEGHFQNQVGPYVIDEFSDYLRGERAIPENFNELKRNIRFWKIVKRTKMFYDLTSGQLKARKALALEFLNEIDKEVKRN